jgi:hypothetical protein
MHRSLHADGESWLVEVTGWAQMTAREKVCGIAFTNVETGEVVRIGVRSSDPESSSDAELAAPLVSESRKRLEKAGE